ncbi:MAG: DNA topoisomerase 3 [Bacteroidaceae bacterium]|nr:DNA topoisomerase 3 [Bacteroidaceae bacterium]
MVVCIAEKPSVAREIANVLGAKSQRDGYLEGNGYQVTWTFGHLCELKEPHEYTPMWKNWSLSALPMIPPRFGIKLKQDKGVEKQFRIIESLMQKADEIINCGDAGQEGELIQHWVMQKAAAKCPVKRLWVNSLTEEAIKEGFQTLKDQSAYQGLYEAGLMRAIGDWLLGMNATRLYTQKYAAGKRQVLSVGRVQTPTLALVVARQREIDNFVPRQSWVLSTLYRDTKFNAIERDEEAEAEDAAAVAAAAEKGKKQKPKGIIYKPLEYATEADGKAIIDSIKDQPFTVLSVEKKKGTEAPPRLYDLTGLQVDCNKKLGLSAEQTLSIIQSLYEKKVTTYPRVDTTFLPDDVYPKCPQTMNGLYQTKFAGVAPYADLIRPLGGKPLRKSKKVFDNSKVTDHHAIIPTGIIPGGLTELEQKVFDLVARAFIAAFYDECKFETTTVMGEVKRDEGTPILFRTTGKVIIDEGWRVVMASANPLSKGDKPAEQEVSPLRGDLEGSFEKGESGPHVPSISEKWTTPPKPYTDATLLRAMETAGKTVEDEELRDALKENGIGRPSTRAAIIETLIRRHYIRRERSSLHPTPTGFELIDLIHYDLLKSAELTGRWEKKLRQIERNEYEARTFLDELKQMVSDIVIAVLREKKTADIQ